jgi:hypothetical protein
MPNKQLLQLESAFIDVLKYGFTLREEKGDLRTYEKRQADLIIVLIEAANMYTLYYWQADNKVNVANRYIVERQEQLDFLILNGRVGWIFKQQPM